MSRQSCCSWGESRLAVESTRVMSPGSAIVRRSSRVPSKASLSSSICAEESSSSQGRGTRYRIRRSRQRNDTHRELLPEGELSLLGSQAESLLHRREVDPADYVDQGTSEIPTAVAVVRYDEAGLQGEAWNV
jgi:hypothetical protein